MTYLPDELAPGCYGSALAFKEDAPLCSACPYADRCAPLHRANLSALRERFGIKDTSPRARPRAKPGVGGQMSLGAKAQALFEKIDGMNLRITEKLAAGQNPFAGQRMAFMLIACHLLLNYRGLLTQDVMSMAYAKRLECKPATADAYARLATQLLSHIGAIDVTEGTLTIRRSN